MKQFFLLGRGNVRIIRAVAIGLIGLIGVLGGIFSSSESAAAGAPPRAGKVDPSDALFTNLSVPRIQVEISQEGMEALRAYQFRKGSNPTARTNVSATIREGGKIYTNVAVHLKGSLGSFRDVDDRPALTLAFDKWVDGQSFHGLKKISLNNSVQDPSYASEIVSREIFRSMGLPTPRATHALVELNGRSLGLYVLLEAWNRQFLKRHFSDVRGNLWDSGSAGDITATLDANSGEHPEDRSILDQLIKTSRETNATHRLEHMGQYLDVDRFFTLMAGEVMLMHWDGYSMNKNNYRVFHDRSVDRLVFLPHGLDQMFGQWRHTPSSSIEPMMRGLVARSVMQCPGSHQRYLERMEHLLNTVYDVPRLTNRVLAVTAKVQRALAGDLSQQARQAASAAALMDRIVRRAESVRDQLAHPEQTVQFGARNELALTNWNNSVESGNAAFRIRPGPVEAFEVVVSGRRTYASWRTELFLEEGDYQLVGRLRLTDAEFGPNVEHPGATLRLSGERDSTMIREASDWTKVTYNFSVVGREKMMLVCEFRATKGTASFDRNSLKLIRRPKASS